VEQASRKLRGRASRLYRAALRRSSGNRLSPAVQARRPPAARRADGNQCGVSLITSGKPGVRWCAKD